MQDNRKYKITNCEDKKWSFEYFKYGPAEGKIHLIFASWSFEQIVFINPILDGEGNDEAGCWDWGKIRVEGAGVYL